MSGGFLLGDGFRLDPARRVLEHKGAPVPLPSRAFDVLTVLVRERHRAVAKDELTAEVWAGVAVTANNLNQSITALRKAFGDTRQTSRFIATIPNLGYQFVAAVEEVEAAATPVVDPWKPPPRWRFVSAATGAAALLAVVLAAAWSASRESGIPPFENLQKNDDQEWLAASLRDFSMAAQAEDSLRGSYSIPAAGKVLIQIRGGARELADLDRFPEALANLLHSANSGNAAQPFAAGMEAWQRGDPVTAAPLLRRAAMLDPRNAATLSALGGALLEMGYLAEAKVLNARAFQVDPGAAAIAGRYHASQGDWDSAIAALTTEWSRHPDRIHAALELATAQFRARKAREARSTLEAASRLVDRASGDPRVLLLTARIHGQFAEMAKVRELAGKASREAEARGLRWVQHRAKLLEAGAAQNLGAYEEAKRLREEARSGCERLGDGPCVGAALRIEGNLAMGMGDPAGAVRCYRAVMERSRKDGNLAERLHVVNGMASALLQTGKYREAEDLVRTAMASDFAPAGWRPMALAATLADVLIAQKKLREAEDWALRAVRDGEESGDRETAAHGYLLTALARKGDDAMYAKAEALFREVGNPGLSQTARDRYRPYARSGTGATQ